MISVLLVDDEPPALDSGKRYLETKGHYKVSTTLSPHTALEMLKTGHYDIIISDYNMPDMDGIGFLKQVRAAYPTLPFILYTSKSRADIGGEAFDNEADFYLQRTGNPILVMEELTQKIQIIVERRKMQEALKASEEQFRLTFELASIGKSLTAIDGKLKKVNRAFCEMLGYTAQELQVKGFVEVTHPDDVAKSQESVRILLTGEHPMYRFLKRYIRKDGAIVWADVSTMLLRDTAGKPLTFVTHIMDITERKNAEDTLRKVNEQLIKSGEMLNETGRMALVGGWEIDVATLQQVWTDEVYRIHEVEPGIMPTVEGGIGFYAPEARPVMAEAVRRAIDVGEPFDLELAFITAKGNRRWVRAKGKALREAGKTVKVQGTFQDITDRKRAEQEIARIAHEWEVTFNATSDGICLIDANQNIQRCNNRMGEMLGGMRHEDLAGKPCWAIIHKTTGPIPACPFVLAKTTLKRTQVEILAGGLWFEVTADPVIDSSGTFAGAVHIMRDITERKHAEEERARLAAIVEQSDEAIIGKTLEGIITNWNIGAERMYGYSAQEMFGKTVSLLVPLDHPDDTMTILERVKNGEPVISYETLRRKKDGGLINVTLTASPVRDTQNRLIGISVIGHDITERKRAEEDLRDSKALIDAVVENVPLMIFLKEATDLRHRNRLPRAPPGSSTPCGPAAAGPRTARHAAPRPA
ncbi:MAG: PAS domain S-box protein, partial [Methanoregula sp.]|nr:PAS domain S-box protein [Methanoregula sp.]